MSLYNIFNWIAVLFLIMNYYPAYKTISKGYLRTSYSYSILNLVENEIFLFICFLKLTYVKDFSESMYSDLAYAAFSTLFSGLLAIFIISGHYDFFEQVSKSAKVTTIVLWPVGVILFCLFLTNSVNDENRIIGLLNPLMLLQIIIPVIIILKFIIQNVYYKSREYQDLEVFDVLFGMIGASIWLTIIILQAYDNNAIFLLENLAKTSIAFFTVYFDALMLISKSRAY